ncbi:MAG: helix-turn-helix domain-containing protein [Lachnospiraceae bacterium]|nr:helix-turn-helix domain-containing protein [Lachnospiraceae bacterium]
MGKRSTKENKNIYFQSRENAGLTRAQASELMEYISESKIEKIENNATLPQPEDVLAMADAYKNPRLCNYYCANECRIGQEHVPEVQITGLPEITLGILSSLNTLDKYKERLIEITEDGKITDDELPDFVKIQDRLDKISVTVEALKLWINNTIIAGELDEEKLKKLRESLR